MTAMQRMMLIPLLLTAMILHADTRDTDAFDPSVCLGFDLPAIAGACGFPSRVYPLRGEEPWQDDVVLRYGDAYSLFLFRDRVWQVRVWEAGGSLGGVRIGDTREQVLEALGNPAGEPEGSLVFNLPDAGYPVRLRVCFSDDVVCDLYLYRADF